MLDKRKLIIIIILAILLIVVLGLAGYWLTREKKQEAGLIQEPGSGALSGIQLPPAEEGTSEDNVIPVRSSRPATPVSAGEKDKLIAENKAKFFIEMLGSYSADARFQNIADLKPMMTTNMQAWADELVKRNAVNLEENNEKMTTQVFKMELLGYRDNRVVFLAQTRRHRQAEEKNKVYGQEAKIVLLKEGNTWKVDEVEWR